MGCDQYLAFTDTAIGRRHIEAVFSFVYVGRADHEAERIGSNEFRVLFIRRGFQEVFYDDEG